MSFLRLVMGKMGLMSDDVFGGYCWILLGKGNAWSTDLHWMTLKFGQMSEE